MLLQPIGVFKYGNTYLQSAINKQNNKSSARNRNIVFKGTTKAGKPIRELHNVPCAFFGITTLGEFELKKIRSGILDCNTVKQTIAYLKRYKDKNMLPTEKKIFEFFEDAAPYSQRMKFPDLLKEWYKEALIKLKLEEFKVIDNVNQISLQMSPETAFAVRKEIVKCENLLTDDNPKKSFKRKTIINALSNIKPKEGEEEIMDHLMNVAYYLPNSITSENAFIVKYANRSHKEISDRLIRDSLLTMDHLLAASQKGPNSLSNFVGASAGANNLKQDVLLTSFIERFPIVIDNSQNYIDFFIDIINKGGFFGHEAYPYKIKTRYLEGSDGKINLDLSSLKYTEKEALEMERIARQLKKVQQSG